MRPSRWCVPQLVNPFLDRNVGSVARSMLNFGLQDLVLVDPQCDHLSQDAITLAAGAESLLRQAFVVSEVRSSLPAAHSPAASHFTAPSLSRDRPRVCTPSCATARQRRSCPQIMPQILAAKCQPEEHNRHLCVVSPGERSPLILSSFPSLSLPSLFPLPPLFLSFSSTHR